MGIRNEIEFGTGFLKDVRNLPNGITKKTSTLLEILRENAFDSRLHVKPLGSPLKHMYSFRITRDWRVGFMFVGSHRIRLLVVDHRDSIYKRMKNLP